ncbi:MAG: thiol-disulfide oxidoreductase DCC family protein [Planctomycetota bacterium]
MTTDTPVPPPLLLYDGECGLCDRTVQAVLERDARGLVHFAPLQGQTARAVLTRHGRDPAPPRFDSVVLVEGFGGARERLVERSDAAIALARHLGGRSASLARFLELIPRPLRDAAYGLVARNRHRLFPPPSACRIPRPGERVRFLP